MAPTRTGARWRAAALKEIYRARNAEAGEAAFDAFDEGQWGRRYPVIAQTWRRHWTAVIPFHAFPADVRRIIYTTNSIEALHAKLRRAVRARGHFPTDEAVLELLLLVLRLTFKEWKMPQREWTAAKAQFAILFEDRFATTCSSRPLHRIPDTPTTTQMPAWAQFRHFRA